MANGMAKRDVEELSYKDLLYIYTAYSSGLTGPYKDYVIAYNVNPHWGKDKKRIKFEEIFPEIWQMMNLKDPSRRTPEEINYDLAVSMGAPPHILEKLKNANT